MIIGRPPRLSEMAAAPRRIQLLGSRWVGGDPNQEPKQGHPSDDAHRQAMAEALGGDAFRPTEAPGVLTGAGRMAEILSQYYGQRAGHDREAWDTNREQKIEGARNGAISDALAGFDPNNPRGMVEGLRQNAPEEALSLAGALAGREPQEMWSEPFDQGGVQVQRSTTTNQLRPVGNPPSAMIYQPPAGYMGTPETGLRPIEGGPADIRATAEGRVQAQAMDSSIRQLENAIGVLTDAEPDVNGGTSGLFADATRNGGVNQGSTDLNEALEPVRAILSFESLQEMRRNSMTGGALGSIAVRELELLGNTVRSLSVRQSPEQLRRNLTETKAQLQRTLQAVRAARQEMENGPDAAPQEPNMAGEQGGGDRVLQYNPQTGRVE